jgi:putative DNA primase/helicase
MPHGGDKEEERKALFSKLLQGKPVLLIDNIERPLSSEVLCAILTAPGKTYSDRILGRSEIVEVPTNITMLATGNNLTFQGDMTRRVLLCTIDPKCETPESRAEFKIKNLEKHVLENRAVYVQAGLTVLKGYFNAGRPKQNIPQYGSFEEWSDLVRSALVWLGQADPCLTKGKIERDDPQKRNLKIIVTLWNAIYNDKPVKVSELAADCNDSIDKKETDSDVYELAQILLEASGSRGKLLDNKAVGKWLSRNKDRVIDGKKFILCPLSTKKINSWQLI